jgi:hypothetical protein
VLAFISVYRIPLETVIQEGSVPENSYKLVKDEKYCGEVKVALTFTPEVIRMKPVFCYFSSYFYA